MRKRWKYILAVGLVVSLAIPARGAGDVGEIRVMLDFPDGIVAQGAVTLYYAGRADGEHYRLTDSFGGGLVKQEDAQSQTLALWLAETAEGRGIPRILDADGTAWFSGMEEGLYLLVQSEQSPGLDPVAPMLIPMPYEGQWELVALPQYAVVMTQVPTTGQPPTLTLAAMTMALSGTGLGICFGILRKKYRI